MLKRIARVLAFAALLALPTLASSTPGRNAASLKPVVEVAFVLDTTGSMDQFLEGAKRKIWSIASAIVDANPDAEIRLALIAYRDRGEEYVTKTFDLTSDLQALYDYLLQLKADGGGDFPESVNEALADAVSNLTWTYNGPGKRIIFLVGDAPPHMDYPEMRYPDILALAHKRDIIVNTVQAGPFAETERVWREIARLGFGQYISIPQGGGMVMIDTPFDAEIAALQKEIADTIVAFGSSEERSRVESRRLQFASAPLGAIGDFATFLSKRARAGRVAEATTGRRDLVFEYGLDPTVLDHVKDSDLPDNLRKMTRAERRAYLDALVKRRAALSALMADLVKKRDAFVAEVRRKDPKRFADAFDLEVAELLREQLRS